jgi:hypothetical protein
MGDQCLGDHAWCVLDTVTMRSGLHVNDGAPSFEFGSGGPGNPEACAFDCLLMLGLGAVHQHSH